MTGKTPKKRSRHGVDRLGRTPLHYACVDGNVALCRQLLTDGADPSAADDNGWAPLHFSAQNYFPEITQLLLRAGADPNARDSYGNSPLWRAAFCSRSRGDVIKLLRDAGADPHLANNNGVTPVNVARTIANYDNAQFFTDLVADQS